MIDRGDQNLKYKDHVLVVCVPVMQIWEIDTMDTATTQASRKGILRSSRHIIVIHNCEWTISEHVLYVYQVSLCGWPVLEDSEVRCGLEQVEVSSRYGIVLHKCEVSAMSTTNARLFSCSRVNRPWSTHGWFDGSRWRTGSSLRNWASWHVLSSIQTDHWAAQDIYLSIHQKRDYDIWCWYNDCVAFGYRIEAFPENSGEAFRARTGCFITVLRAWSGTISPKEWYLLSALHYKLKKKLLGSLIWSQKTRAHQTMCGVVVQVQGIRFIPD